MGIYNRHEYAAERKRGAGGVGIIGSVGASLATSFGPGERLLAVCRSLGHPTTGRSELRLRLEAATFESGHCVIRPSRSTLPGEV
jgi:hypothetical protein